MIPDSKLLSAEELTYHVGACVLNRRESQKMIYESFYKYAMAVSDRFTNNKEDALEILNDGFLKIFKEIHRYKPAYDDVVNSFKGWLRKIMVYTAIDHFRRNQKHQVIRSSDEVGDRLSSGREDALEKLTHEEIIRAVQKLSPGFRAVLNLFAIEGFSHEEIAKKLGISVGTSKSNLSKARKQLEKILSDQNNFFSGIRKYNDDEKHGASVKRA